MTDLHETDSPFTAAPTTRESTVTASSLGHDRNRDEIAHVFGAKHPKDASFIEPGTGGIMCKYSCWNINDLSYVAGIAIISKDNQQGISFERAVTLLGIYSESKEWMLGTNGFSTPNEMIITENTSEVAT